MIQQSHSWAYTKERGKFQFKKICVPQCYSTIYNSHNMEATKVSINRWTDKDVEYTPWDVACLLAKSLQSCPTLCDPVDSSPPGSPVPGILQARTLEWVAISFSNAWKWKVKVKSLSHVRLLATPWTHNWASGGKLTTIAENPPRH